MPSRTIRPSLDLPLNRGLSVSSHQMVFVLAIYPSPQRRSRPLQGTRRGCQVCRILRFTFNLKAIDAIHVTIDKEENEATVIPIQITKADRHSDSEAAFFAQW